MATPATTGLAPGLSRKVKKILEIKTETPELISALGTLSTIIDDNTPAVRRQLRSTIESRGLDISGQFLAAAETMIKDLDGIQSELDALNNSCSAMGSALSAAKASSSGLLGEAERLQRELGALKGKAAAVQQFLEQYQLTPEEVAVLQGGAVGPLFFTALERVHAIHDNCRALLRSHHQRAGLELMDQMSGHQESAYEHLCRWVQAECRNLGEFDAPEVDPVLTAAVAALRQRPVLFKYCAEEVATARHNALFQRFIIALTRGGPGGLPRPIEMHAHDPRRYVADMLAWVHQVLASEREFVLSLFGVGEEGEAERARHSDASGGRSSDPAAAVTAAAGRLRLGDGAGVGSPTAAARRHASAEVEGLSHQALLARIFESLCKPLKVRVEQVLLMTPPLLLCYQLSQLVGFYHALVERVLGSEAALTLTIAGCRDMATRTFMEQLRAAGDRLLKNPPAPPADLSPPQQVAATLQTLSEVMNAHESALHAPPSSSSSDGTSAEAAAFTPVLEALLGPLLEMCRRSAAALAVGSPDRLDEGVQLDPAAHPIYLINCLAACHAATSLRPFCSGATRQLQQQIQDQVGLLVAGAVQRLLGVCGLAEIVDRMKLYQLSAGQGADGVPAADSSLSLHTITEALRSFFVAVSSPDALPEFTALQQPRLRSEAVSRVAAELVGAYEMVYQVLQDPGSGYAAQGGAAGVKHTPMQVRTILGVL